MDKRLVVSKVDPVIKIEKTEGKNAHWVTSGVVSLAVARGDGFALGALEIPFHDADSRSDAYAQAMKTLELVIERLADCMEAVRGGGDSERLAA